MKPYKSERTAYRASVGDYPGIVEVSFDKDRKRRAGTTVTVLAEGIGQTFTLDQWRSITTRVDELLAEGASDG